MIIPEGLHSLFVITLIAAVAPLIVAITAIGQQTGVMRPENAAALVGAGLLSVIFLPMFARMLPRPSLVAADDADPVPVVE